MNTNTAPAAATTTGTALNAKANTSVEGMKFSAYQLRTQASMFFSRKKKGRYSNTFNLFFIRAHYANVTEEQRIYAPQLVKLEVPSRKLFVSAQKRTPDRYYVPAPEEEAQKLLELYEDKLPKLEAWLQKAQQLRDESPYSDIRFLGFEVWHVATKTPSGEKKLPAGATAIEMKIENGQVEGMILADGTLQPELRYREHDGNQTTDHVETLDSPYIQAWLAFAGAWQEIVGDQAIIEHPPTVDGVLQSCKFCNPA